MKHPQTGQSMWFPSLDAVKQWTNAYMASQGRNPDGSEKPPPPSMMDKLKNWLQPDGKWRWDRVGMAAGGLLVVVLGLWFVFRPKRRKRR